MVASNVLLITIDCLRRDRCGVYGYHRNTTPTLDSLARESFVFENAFATGPVTAESFPGILAGRLSTECVAGDSLWRKKIPGGEPTIASHLQNAGWSTTGVISNPRIGKHVDLDRGFGTFRNLRTTNAGDDDTHDTVVLSGLLPNIEIGGHLYDLREQMRDLDSIPYRYLLPFLAFRTYQYISGWPSVRGEQVVDEFLTEISNHTEKFFCWTHLMDVHGPLHPDTVSDGELYHSGLYTQFRSHANRVSDIYDLQTEGRYDSAIRYADQQVNRIIDYLKHNDLWDNTVLIVTADHGEALYDRGVYGHPQHYLYNELLEVPLIVRVPGRDGNNLKYPFSLGWLHELVTELCACPPMDAPLSFSDNVLSEKDAYNKDIIKAASVSPLGQSISVQRGNNKYVRQTGDLGSDGSSTPRVGVPGVYMLDRDPRERSPEQKNEPELEEVADEIELSDPSSLQVRENSMDIDSETKDQLKQLGYAE